MTKNLLFIVGLFGFGSQTFANSLTVRDIQLKESGVVEIQLDGMAPKNSLDIDFVRDIVQFSIQNATIYPAKILHAESNQQVFNKVFAYQYAPNLVRVRFSVDGKADQFKGKIHWEQKGKVLTLNFPVGKVVKSDDTDSHERSLLAKVLGQGDSVKVEKTDAKSESKLELKKEIHLTGLNAAPATSLGGAKPVPSALRSFMAMLLVVGGLGMVLVYVKKKKSGMQANKVGNSWLSKLIPGGKSSKALIEIVATHSLGPKQSITVVRIRGQQFVLGVSADSVQLITQLDSDENEIDVMDDPKVADSIGRMFGSKPQVISVNPTKNHVNAPAKPSADLGASFNAMLKTSTGAGAIVARNAYQAQSPERGAYSEPQGVRPQAVQTISQNSVRDQIKQRLQGMKNV